MIALGRGLQPQALLPLAASEPIVFHGVLAVASAHWANRLNYLKTLGGTLGADSEEQLRVLELASSVSEGPRLTR